MTLKSLFEVRSIGPTRIVIKDTGHNSGYASVTNDAEAVVKYLHETLNLSGRMLLYYDSENNLDQLVHDDFGNFLGFKSFRQNQTV